MPTTLQSLSTEMADIVENVRRSIVHVKSGRVGAGVWSIRHTDGLIVTNAHVVQSRSLRVSLPDGRNLPANVLAHDQSLDLAALSIEPDSLPTIDLGDSQSLEPGQFVTAMGHPWGVAGAVSAGVVIGLETQGEHLPVQDREWVVANLPLRPGHSGGPMMDAEGRLVAINTMISGPEVAMAVPVQVVKRFLGDSLKEEQPRMVKEPLNNVMRNT